MLPAKYRLQLRRTLPFYLFDRKAHTPLLSLYWRKVPDALPAQVAIVVPKKVVKTAVLRNRTKRVLSSALLELMPTLPQGLQMVILVRHHDLVNQPQEVLQMLNEKFLQ